MNGHPGTRQRRILRVDRGGNRSSSEDWLVAEAPLELRAGGVPMLVIMRTPGHDRELAHGLLFSEGMVTDGTALTLVAPEGLRPEERGNVLETGLPAEHQAPARRLPITAGCGVCGKRAIADLELRAEVVHASLPVTAALIASLPERLRRAQALFERTGGLHAAAAFDDTGALHAIREDVGRHNAVDKLIGWALTAGRVPLSSSILCVSGRIGFEIVQKAVVAGFPMVVAVSAPSSLAVDLAERFRVTLCGFNRGGSFNVYSHDSRVVSS